MIDVYGIDWSVNGIKCLVDYFCQLILLPLMVIFIDDIHGLFMTDSRLFLQ